MNKKIRSLLIIILVILVIGMICFGIKNQIETKEEEREKSQNTISTEVNREELLAKMTVLEESRYEFSETTEIKLRGTTVEIDGVGATLKTGADSNTPNTIEITKGGCYKISGTLENGRIVVNEKEEDVKLILENVEINCDYSAPIYSYKSKSTMILLAEDTENRVSDVNIYSYVDNYSSQEEEEPNACIYSKSDLLVCGGGSLEIKANQNNALTSKDTLLIEDSNISILAQNHGINGKDNVTIQNATITIQCNGDGIRSTNDTDVSMGWIHIENSRIKIEAKEDGIQAETDLILRNGMFEISTALLEALQKESEEISCKGIEAGNNLLLENVEMNLDTYDDAIHANANIQIVSGSYTIKTGNDGIHADETVTIENGQINILDSYEGIEGDNIVIRDGDIQIVSSDDGINVAGGMDSSGFQKGGRMEKTEGNMMGGMKENRIWQEENVSQEKRRESIGVDDKINGNSGKMMLEENRKSVNTLSDNKETTNYLSIEGGTIVINANGDGLDSNGGIVMAGGNVTIYGPTNSGNGAIDYNSTFEISNGTLIALGASGMAQSPSKTSTQYFVNQNVAKPKEGAEIVVKDSSGNEVISCTAQKTFSNIVVSTPEMKETEKYSIYINGELQ